jgi:hypothetical protein
MAIHKKRSNISEEVRNDHGEREVEKRAGLKETIKDAWIAAGRRHAAWKGPEGDRE